jgi:HB1, ASXL, restriction endonuclease HTH domain
MNDQPIPYDAVIADLRTKRDQIDALIQMLEVFRNWAPPPVGGLPEPTLLGGLLTAATTPSKGIAPGSFHGKSIEDATEAILHIRKRSLAISEIVADLQAGGVHFRGDTPVNTVTSVLHRASKKGGNVVRINRGTWGLREWHPNRKFD